MSLYSGLNFFSYMIVFKIFFQPVADIFNPTLCFSKHYIFALVKSKLSIFHFMDYASGVLSKNLSLNLRTHRFSAAYF
jgi:hypothetical protein